MRSMFHFCAVLVIGVVLGSCVGVDWTSHSEDLELRSYVASAVVDAEAHTMGESLKVYLENKVHHLLKEREFRHIWVIGDADRSGIASKHEKKDKNFNWQRPTASVSGDDVFIKVFPGREYVKHYATLIATYFALQGKDWSHVRYVLPNEEQAWEAVTQSNLCEVPEGDVAILGSGLEVLVGDEDATWQGEGNFSWIEKTIGTKRVVFIGGKHSYWGDIAGRIVTLLAKKNFKQVIYVGKVGGMDERGIPNQTLATGDNSFVDGETVCWKNLFDFAKGDKGVVFGAHYTIPSVLNETKEWLENNRHYAFIDNEIGFMAKAAQSASIQFSYLHIISDNLWGGFVEDLTNERGILAKHHRAALLRKAKALIEEALQDPQSHAEGSLHEEQTAVSL